MSSPPEPEPGHDRFTEDDPDRAFVFHEPETPAPEPPPTEPAPQE